MLRLLDYFFVVLYRFKNYQNKAQGSKAPDEDLRLLSIVIMVVPICANLYTIIFFFNIFRLNNGMTFLLIICITMMLFFSYRYFFSSKSDDIISSFDDEPRELRKKRKLWVKIYMTASGIIGLWYLFAHMGRME